MNPETISGDQVAKMYRKEFTHTPAKEIAREVRLQQTSAALGLSPAGLKTDHKTVIRSEMVDD